MISRLIFCALVGGFGLSSTYPAAPQPLTSSQLQAKAKYKSVSNMCKHKKKSKTARELCQRWEEQQNG